MRIRAPPVVVQAHDLAVPHDDDLKQARDEAACTEPLETLPAQLHEHAVAELEHLAGAQTVRSGAPEQRTDDLVGVLARLPSVFLRRMPRRIVVEEQAQRLVVGAAREPVHLLDGVRERACHLRDERQRLHDRAGFAPRENRVGDGRDRLRRFGPGNAATIGTPASPCSRSNGSSGTWPSSGTSSSAASAAPPP